MGDINAILALVAFIAVIIVWSAIFKRNIAESMFIGFVISCLFAGKDALTVGWSSLLEGLKSDITFSALAFVFTSALLTELGIIGRIIDLISSFLGRVRGGAVYAGTIGSGLFGSVAHSGPAIAATIGSITIPWMKRSGTSAPSSALVLSGNAGVGAVFPFSGSFFLMLAAPGIHGKLTADDVLLPLFWIAFVYVVVRVLIAAVLIRRERIGRMSPEDVLPILTTLRLGWSSALVPLAIAIPVLFTTGPTGDLVAGRVGAEGSESIALLIWLPIVMLIAGVIIGWKALPKTTRAWWKFGADISPKFGVLGVTMISAFAASSLLGNLGLGEQLAPFIEGLQGVPKIVTVCVVAMIIVVVSGPLSTTATVAAVGSISFVALVSVGVHPVLAFAAIVVWASAEGCTPPGAAPLYVAAGIADCDPITIFKPIIYYYLIPTVLLGIVIAMGYIPVPGV